MKQTQTEWILARLKQGPVTAIDALDHLDRTGASARAAVCVKVAAP